MTMARWPAKSCEFVLDLLKNAESNAEVITRFPRKIPLKWKEFSRIQGQGAPKERSTITATRTGLSVYQRKLAIQYPDQLNATTNIKELIFADHDTEP
ncbi:hypothetical protein BGZ74_006776, partial [Mortierella antarctica]